MRSFYFYLGTGVQREASWFRPLTEEEVPFPEPDWNNHEDIDVNESISNQETMDTPKHTVYVRRTLVKMKLKKIFCQLSKKQFSI